MQEHITWKSNASIPYGHLRDSYPEWLPKYSKVKDLIAQQLQRKREREEIKAQSRALVDVKKSFLASLKNFIEFSQVQALKRFISSYARHADPVNELRGELPDSPLRVFSFWPDSIVEKAFEELEETWPENAIADIERKKKLDAIDRDIVKIDKEISKYPDFPIWHEFVESWQILNGKVSEGCDPQGFPITAGKKPGEKEAFAKLKMAEFINPKSNFLPAVP